MTDDDSHRDDCRLDDDKDDKEENDVFCTDTTSTMGGFGVVTTTIQSSCWGLPSMCCCDRTTEDIYKSVHPRTTKTTTKRKRWFE